MKDIWQIYKLCEFEVSVDDCNIFLLTSLGLRQYKAPHGTLNLYHKKLNTRKQIWMHLIHCILILNLSISIKWSNQNIIALLFSIRYTLIFLIRENLKIADLPWIDIIIRYPFILFKKLSTIYQVLSWHINAFRIFKVKNFLHLIPVITFNPTKLVFRFVYSPPIFNPMYFPYCKVCFGCLKNAVLSQFRKLWGSRKCTF